MNQPSVKRLPRRYKNFIRGPISDEWMQKAGLISPIAIAIGVILWKMAHKDKLWGFNGLQRMSDWMPLSNCICAKYGIKRSSKMNVLNEMEQAGLIKLRIPEWKTVEVKIVDDYLTNKISPSGYSQPY